MPYGMLSVKHGGAKVHNNDVYYALQRALWRHFQDWRDTAEGREKTKELVLDLMEAIKESGLDYVNAAEKELIDAKRP